MNSQFCCTSPTEAPVVASFLQRIFDADPGLPFISPRNLHWKCWEPRSDWAGSRGYAVTKDGAMVAHGTVVPLTCLIGPRQMKMVHLIDWAADPKSVGSGVTLLKRIAQMVDAILISGGSEMTQKVLPSLGFKTCGAVTRFARPVRPFMRLTGEKLSVQVAARFARSMLWSLQVPARPKSAWTANFTELEQVPSAAIKWPCAIEGTTIFERNADAMAYFLKCSVLPMALYSVAKDGVPRGYFLLAHAPGQARIADFYIDSDAREDWRVLIELAVSNAMRDPTVAEVVSVGSDAMTRQALIDSGFHARGEYNLCLLLRKGTELPAWPIRFHLIDSDDAYLHEGKNSYWA